MAIAFPFVAFAGVLLATFRSLGWGFLAMFAVGYFNGVIRANYLGVYTTFMFDAAVLGLYLGFIFKQSRRTATVKTPARPIVFFLIAWPTLLSILPINHYLVQLVALRPTVWLLPTLLIATRLTTADLALMTRGLAALNLVALAGGVYVYRNGVESLYPMNAVTRIIYMSADLGGYHRVPSTFLSAHAYGGTMVLTLPFLFDRLAGIRGRQGDGGLAEFGVGMVDRWLPAAGVVAAVGGLLMCGARSPMVLFLMALVITWFLTRFSLVLGLVVAVLVTGGLKVASTNERFQRVSTLQDTEMVGRRLAGSANEHFLELMGRYPGGAGMGSAVGTSVPYFLSEVAPEQIGLENEYCRILVDQGWVGLGGWLAFLGWMYVRPPPARKGVPWRLGVVFMYSLTLALWMSAFTGTGALSAIPGTALLLTQMGVVVGVRARGAVPGAVNPHPAPVSAGPGTAPGMIRGPGWVRVAGDVTPPMRRPRE